MSFLYPLFLLSLVSLSIPIIIHLFSKKEMETQAFPSLLFLIEKRSPRFYWLRFREIVLLFVRVLGLLFLIFAFSGTLIHSKYFQKSYSRVVVDNSLSMDNRAKVKQGYIRTKTKGGICKLDREFQSRVPTLFITDLQKINFIPFLNQGMRFSNVFIKDVGMPKNAGIIEVKTGPAVVGREGYIYVKILNNDVPIKRVLKIYIDGTFMGAHTINLVKGENKFSFPFIPENGIHYGWVEISPDEMRFDDKRYFTYNGISQENIGIISDKEPRTIESALTAMGFNTYWSTEFTGDAQFLIVIKSDITGLRSAMFGRKAIISIPDSIDPHSYRTVLGVLTSKKNQVKSQMLSVPEDNFLFPLKDYLKGCYISPSFKIGNSGDIMLKDGSPFLMKLNKDVAVFNISFINNPLIYHPIFIPILYYTISALSSPHQEDRIIDDKIVIKTRKRNKFLAITPEGKKIPFQEIVRKNSYEYVFKETKKQGIYKIYKDKEFYDEIAINPDPLESNTEVLDNEEKKSLFPEKMRADISLLFLLFSIILMIIETFIERR